MIYIYTSYIIVFILYILLLNADGSGVYLEVDLILLPALALVEEGVHNPVP